ncbi:hypothetical protein [Kitasatospora cineracea]|uniref:Uncharacterized protein n=1 Tax=Kitasatospora cineracea TaxID=88074 RepID=A0A3N4RW07_9ACTN|nr:hypothetical protein [Kitasatospora cineracea]RPE34955.1 hypothetical protein EDD38_3298 [Kitasatospora cineracea]
MTDRQPSARQKLAALLDAAGVEYATADAAITAVLAEQTGLSAHVLELANPDRDADFSAGVDWAVATLRAAAAKMLAARTSQEA